MRLRQYTAPSIDFGEADKVALRLGSFNIEPNQASRVSQNGNADAIALE
jgi:hypothetical protein